MGLMLAVELPTPALAEALQWEAFTRGLLVLGCGKRAVRVSPPLVIDEATMTSGLTVLEEATEAVADGGTDRQERPMAQAVDPTVARDSTA
jgi:4-aminobutyrate aminotransferase